VVKKEKRLSLGSDFSLSRRISAAARSTLRVARVTRTYDTAFKDIIAHLCLVVKKQRMEIDALVYELCGLVGAMEEQIDG
jgi:hypothetical protein